MTTQTQTTEERLSKLEGVYEQVNERLRDLGEEMRQSDAALRTDMNERFNDLARGQESLRAEVSSLKTTIIAIGGAMWASTVGGFIALIMTM